MTDNDEVPNTERDGGAALLGLIVIVVFIGGVLGGLLWSSR